MAPISSPGGSGTARSKSCLRAIAIASVRFKFRQFRYRLGCEGEIIGVDLQTHTAQSAGGCCRDGRARTHKGVQNQAFPQRESRAHDLAEEVLRLTGGVRSRLAFDSPGG